MDSFNKKCRKYQRFGLPTIAKTFGFYPYFNVINSEQEPIVRMDDKEIIMLGSNNYLGMTANSIVKKSAIDAIEKYGSGTTGSRLLNGTFQIHKELEIRLAKFLGKEDCVIFSTGMQANIGTLSSLIGEKDQWVLSDELNHASIIDGIVLSRMTKGNKAIYGHNNMDELRGIIKKIPKGKAMIVTEGVFSMEGDICPLDEIVEIADENDAFIFLDDAHSVGVLGNGRGTASHFNLTEKVDIIMGTFSKSFASCGGYIASSKAICNWLRHNSRAFIFSASIPPANCATVLAVLDILENDDSYSKRVLDLAERMRKGLKDANFDIGNSLTPIIPIVIGKEMLTYKFFKKLFYYKPKGIFTNPIRSPAVSKGRELLRTSYMATMNNDIIDESLDIITQVGKKLKIV
ncbi:MAG: aminotransferase class I/II-fold pyridoxal phosphate-dependent enzyme [Candidatus Thermoplasmatota archaeon]|nr:aminotransferase class I/II-fold pyridoxal phosphate-dependent enzyme [Candidatus Thermoplasmatota archaeon]MCK5300408.1 aminotransferase class I/II-fold pyridoxal phosphate-dependent enzyme [Thermoplasmatales archaeon]